MVWILILCEEHTKQIRKERMLPPPHPPPPPKKGTRKRVVVQIMWVCVKLEEMSEGHIMTNSPKNWQLTVSCLSLEKSFSCGEVTQLCHLASSLNVIIIKNMKMLYRNTLDSVVLGKRAIVWPHAHTTSTYCLIYAVKNHLKKKKLGGHFARFPLILFKKLYSYVYKQWDSCFDSAYVVLRLFQMVYILLFCMLLLPFKCYVCVVRLSFFARCTLLRRY